MAGIPTVARVRLETALAGLSGALGLLTLVFRDWLEVFGWDPDQGSGAVEAAIVVVLLAVSAVLAWGARRHHHILLAASPG